MLPEQFSSDGIVYESVVSRLANRVLISVRCHTRYVSTRYYRAWIVTVIDIDVLYNISIVPHR